MKCKENDIQVSNEVILEILKRTGHSLGIISNELEKLFSYTSDKKSYKSGRCIRNMQCTAGRQGLRYDISYSM